MNNLLATFSVNLNKILCIFKRFYKYLILILLFYKFFMVFTLLISFLSSIIIFKGGLFFIPIILFFKLITTLFVIYYINVYKSKYFYFFYNLEISKNELWIGSLILDLFIFIILIIIVL